MEKEGRRQGLEERGGSEEGGQRRGGGSSSYSNGGGGDASGKTARCTHLLVLSFMKVTGPIGPL